VRRGGRKGGPGRGQKGKEEESDSSCQGKKDLSHIKCFRCDKHGHYASQCPERKKGKGKQQQQQGVCKECRCFGVDDLTAKLDTHFAMVSSLSMYTVSGVGWYVDSGASRHMTYDRKIFNRFQEQEGGMLVELGDDAMYPVKGLGSISFQMPSR
jgi:hypothetical protein